MKKIGHESIESYKRLKFNTFSFLTPRKFFPLCYLCYWFCLDLLCAVYVTRCTVCGACLADFIIYFPIALYVHGNLMFMSYNY